MNVEQIALSAMLVSTNLKCMTHNYIYPANFLERATVNKYKNMHVISIFINP